MHCRFLAMAIAIAAFPASAQDAEVSKLREALRQLQQQVRALESARGSGAFNPEISLILQGTFARSSRHPETYEIGGFAPSGGEVGPPPRGFGLGESELILGANIDPYFRGQLVAALTPDDELEVEEAYFQTLALGRGFTLRGGRFLSAIGYQNEIHQHAWDFQDAPLAYKAFLGGRLNDDGVQARWVAPAELFLELGGELGRGGRFPATDRNRNGADLMTAFGRVGGDMGASTAWRAGLSFLRSKPEERAFTDLDSLGAEVTQSFSGRSRMWIADFVAKWAPGGNSAQKNLKLQGEYFRRNESGTIAYQALEDGYASRQSGWYAQAVYQFVPRWRVGFRHDRLGHSSVRNDIVTSGAGPTAADFRLLMAEHNPTRNTAMVDFSPSEFSRFRVQYAADRSRVAVTDHQLTLQYIHSLGAHGAHRF